MTPARPTVIEVRGLRNQFGEQVVHDNLDLDVYRGEILGVVGGSGSGKSVLLRSIIGLNHPAAGSVKLLGEEMTHIDEARRSAIEQRCGVLFQNGALFSSLSVTDNVMVPMREHYRLSAAMMQRLAALKIALAGLPPDAGAKFPAELSGGMVKRAALARSLALDPDILFLDEPTSGLDPIGAAAFDRLILTLRESLGLTVFLITHDLDTLYTICDRVAVISQKRVLVAGTLADVAGYDDAWVHDYFQGPRGRAAETAAAHAGARAAHEAPGTAADAATSKG
jgi:phospholipid/cholesterol/gamma-HCH transport system ATP-binding protein